MIEVPVLKEIRSYETKVVGPLTLRGLVCMSIAAAGAYILYAIQKYLIGITPVGMLCCMGAAPGVAFLVIKPYGLKLEKYIKSAFIDNLIAPRVRPYKQEMNYDALYANYILKDTSFEECSEENLSVEELPKKKNKKKKKNLPPELIGYK